MKAVMLIYQLDPELLGAYVIGLFTLLISA
jgi:hypothetical protein